MNEAYTTQTCSCCKALTGPKGEKELNSGDGFAADAARNTTVTGTPRPTLPASGARRWACNGLEAPAFALGRHHPKV